MMRTVRVSDPVLAGSLPPSGFTYLVNVTKPPSLEPRGPRATPSGGGRAYMARSHRGRREGACDEAECEHAEDDGNLERRRPEEEEHAREERDGRRPAIARREPALAARSEREERRGGDAVLQRDG